MENPGCCNRLTNYLRLVSGKIGLLLFFFLLPKVLSNASMRAYLFHILGKIS